MIKLEKGTYYTRRSSLNLYKYLGESVNGGKFLATHKVNMWNEVTPIDKPCVFDLPKEIFFKSAQTLQLTLLLSKKKKREDKLKILLSN